MSDVDIQELVSALWGIFNSPVVISAIAGVVLWALNKLYASKPAWAKYEGAIIAAVKFAEKEIPDNTTSPGLSRLDTALRYVVKVFEEVNGRRPSKAEKAVLREGIQITHAELEVAGVLRKG